MAAVAESEGALFFAGGEVVEDEERTRGNIVESELIAGALPASEAHPAVVVPVGKFIGVTRFHEVAIVAREKLYAMDFHWPLHIDDAAVARIHYVALSIKSVYRGYLQFLGLLGIDAQISESVRVVECEPVAINGEVFYHA